MVCTPPCKGGVYHLNPRISRFVIWVVGSSEYQAIVNQYLAGSRVIDPASAKALKPKIPSAVQMCSL